MFGVVSSNLEQTISDYLVSKNIEVKLNITKPVQKQNIDEIITRASELETIIIDTTSFYDDQILMEVIFKLKVEYSDLRIILISFSKRQLTDAAILGVYDIIYYKKTTNLFEELDELILNPKTLKDIKEFLNLQIIQTQKQNSSFNNIILSVSFNSHVYATSFWLNYANHFSEEKRICIVEVDSQKSDLTNLFKPSEKAQVNNLSLPIFNYNNFGIIFSNKTLATEEDILKLILTVSQNYDEVILQLSHNSLEAIEFLLGQSSKIYSFDRVSLYDDLTDIKEKIYAHHNYISEIQVKTKKEPKHIEEYLTINNHEVLETFQSVNKANLLDDVFNKVIKKMK